MKNNIWKGIAILGIGIAIATIGYKNPDAGVGAIFFSIIPLIIIAVQK